MLAVLLFAGSFGCSPKEDESVAALAESLMRERNDLQEKLTAAQRTLDETQKELTAAKEDAEAARQALEKVQTAPTAEPVVVTETKEVEKKIPAEYAYGVDCTVNGAESAMLDGDTKIKCVPKKIDGYVFDHWEVNGTRQDGTEKGLELTVSKTTQIRAVFHERHVVKCINCHIQFLNEKGNASGKNYTEFDFEEEYKNPVTNKKEKAGLISFYIFADTPKKQEIDYWLINGVKYQYPKDISKFRVEELNEATVYEVVFKGQTKTTSGKTYNVVCHNCKFSYNGKTYTSGKVPAGASITIKAGPDSSSEGDFWGTPSNITRRVHSNGFTTGYTYSWSYTVNSDVEVWFSGVVN